MKSEGSERGSGEAQEYLSHEYDISPLIRYLKLNENLLEEEDFNALINGVQGDFRPYLILFLVVYLEQDIDELLAELVSMPMNTVCIDGFNKLVIPENIKKLSEDAICVGTSHDMPNTTVYVSKRLTDGKVSGKDYLNTHKVLGSAKSFSENGRSSIKVKEY